MYAKREKNLKEAHIKSGGPLNHNSKYRTSHTDSNGKTVISKNNQERFNREKERKRDRSKERARIEDEKDNIMMTQYDELKKEEAKQEEAKKEKAKKQLESKTKEVTFNKKGKSGNQIGGETKNTGHNKRQYQDKRLHQQQCKPRSQFNSPPT